MKRIYNEIARYEALLAVGLISEAEYKKAIASFEIALMGSDSL